MTKLDDIKEIAKDMIAEDRDRDAMFAEIDKMFRNQWDLPKMLKIRQWIRKVTSTDAHDQIRAATRLLSNLKETIRFNPYSDNPEEKATANRIEKSLKWNLVNTSKRRKSSIKRDLVMSAIKYDAVMAQVDYLPYQYSISDIAPKRKKIIDRFGPFVINIHNPQNVHVRYSNYMPEEVVVCYKSKKKDVLDYWGDKASLLKSDKKIDDRDEVFVFDYCDTEVRAVWCTENMIDDKAYTIINPASDEGKHKLPFLPWVCRVGGTTLEDDPQHQYIPLLYAAVNAKQWITQNIIETLAMSQAISKSDANKLAFGGPGADDVYVDYTNPSQNIILPPGVNVQPIQQSPLDRQLLDLANFFQSAMDKSGVSRVLQGGSLPAGTSFAAYDLVSQASLGAVTPYKELAELALSDILTQFLLWCHFRGDNLEGYGLEQGRKGDYGKKYVITPQDYEPEDICIEVELNPDLPIDRNKRINGAVMMVERLGLSQEEALEDLGYPDPAQIQKEKFMEQLLNALKDAEVQRILGAVQIELTAQTQEIQMQAQAQAQEIQMQAQAQAQGPTAQQMPPPGAAPGLGEQLQGMGMNPDMGGTPPQNFAPEATFEGQTGEARPTGMEEE